MADANVQLQVGKTLLEQAGADEQLLGGAVLRLDRAVELELIRRLPESETAVQNQGLLALISTLVNHQLLDRGDADQLYRLHHLRDAFLADGVLLDDRSAVTRYAALAERLITGATTAPASDESAPAQESAAPESTPSASASTPVFRIWRTSQRPSWRRQALTIAGGLLLALIIIRLLPQTPGTSTPRIGQRIEDFPILTAQFHQQAANGGPPLDTTSQRHATVSGLNGGRLPIFEKVGFTAPRIFDLGEGTQITVLGESVSADGMSWYQIEYNGQRGWSPDDHLTFTDES